MSSTEPPTKKQRLIQVPVEDNDTKQTLLKKLDDAAQKEFRYMEAKKTFLLKIRPEKESFKTFMDDCAWSIMSHLRGSLPNRDLADRAKFSRSEITAELKKYDKETQEYILETTDVYRPLQFFEGKKACLRELVKEVAERVELLEEKDL